jgi:pyruvyl transferase EpsO
VITDRLHAFILSTLLGIENYVFDSRGGKVGNFHNTWSKSFKGSKLVTEVDEIQLKQK